MSSELTRLQGVARPVGTQARPESAAASRSVLLARQAIRALDVVASCGLATLFVVVLLQVISRFIVRRPLTWTQDGATMLLIWTSFLGALVAAYDRQHFAIEFFVDLLPQRPRRFVIGLANLLAASVLAVMVWLGWQFARQQMEQMYLTLPFSKGWTTLAIPVCSALMVPRYLLDAWLTWFGPSAPPEPPPGEMGGTA